jgi:hypothetical protein
MVLRFFWLVFDSFTELAAVLEEKEFSHVPYSVFVEGWFWSSHVVSLFQHVR